MERSRAFTAEDLVNWLGERRALSDWRLTVKQIETQEYFFVRRQLDMQRAKNIEKYDLVLYRDVEEGGITYRGLYQLSLHPTLSFSEAKEAIEIGIESAKFLKNPFFPIPEGSAAKSPEKTSVSPFAIEDYLNALFDGMEEKAGGVNSCEVSFEKVHTTIRNSRGVFVSFLTPRIFTEVILDWKGEREEVELIEYLNARTVEPDNLRKEMSRKLYLVQERGKAQQTFAARQHPVVLSREAVGEFLSYYAFQTNAESVYQKSSLAQPGQPIQGKNPVGDRLTLTMIPNLENNPNSCPYDQEGAFLEPLSVIRDGEVQELWGERRFTYYLDRKATGSYPLMKVNPGTMTRERVGNGPVVGVTRCSDFSIDPLTGDFAGEIRLGWQDGRPVTGGSISGNIHKVETSMRFSDETARIEKGEVPAFLVLENIDIAGQ